MYASMIPHSVLSYEGEGLLVALDRESTGHKSSSAM